MLGEENKPVLVYDEANGLLYPSDIRPRDDFKEKKIEEILRDKTLKVRFLTPTRIVYNGQLVKNLTFFIFLKGVISRVNDLIFLYSSIDNFEYPKDAKENLLNNDFNFRELLELSKQIEIKEDNLYWFDWKRYSKRQNRKMTLGGLMGEIIFEGNFSKFIPFLILGEYLHIGKNTTFGLGKYLIE
jgi:hypothetical protein